MTVAASVDLRSKLCPVRNQGVRPTCLAFALSELNRFFGHGTDPLSPDYLYLAAASRISGWRPHMGLRVDAALAAILRPGQPLESDHPYTNVEPSVPLSPLPTFAKMHANSFVARSFVLKRLEAELRSGSPVGMGILLTHSFYRPSSDGIVRFDAAAIPDSGHAVVAVGLGNDTVSGHQHTLIRNSWGDAWGIGGYAWVPNTYLNQHALCIFGNF